VRLCGVLPRCQSRTYGGSVHYPTSTPDGSVLEENPHLMGTTYKRAKRLEVEGVTQRASGKSNSIFLLCRSLHVHAGQDEWYRV
jgi:hypothetical protein